MIRFGKKCIEFTGIILGMGSSNERRCDIVTLSLIGWAHTQNDEYTEQGPMIFFW